MIYYFIIEVTDQSVKKRGEVMKKAVKSLDKKEKKKYIAETALQLISEKGLSNLTMESVAVSCNLSKGSLYNYFKNKDALIIAAFGALLEKIQHFFEDKNSDSNDNCVEKSAEIYSNLYSEILNTFHSNELLRLFEILINSTHDNKMMEVLTQTFKDYYGNILNKFEKIFNSKTKAFMLQAMFDGLVLYRSVGVEFSDKEVQENFKKLILCFTE
jgi:AcrR family transcriptional regulator